MWRNDELGSGRNLRGRQSVLHVNTKLRRERGRDNGTLVLAVAGLAAVLALVLIWYGFMTAGRRLFSENPAYTIRRIEVKTGEQVPADLAREYLSRLGVQEGTNLFAVDIGRIGDDFVKRQPAIRSVEVARLLPDRLLVQIEERMPLATIGTLGTFVVDREGLVFPNRWKGRALPALSGFASVRLMPGARLNKLGLAALQVVEACAGTEIGIDVREVDVEQRECLIMKLGDAKTVKISWPKMGDTSQEALGALRTRLLRVAQVLQTPEGKAAQRLDATYEDRVYAQGVENPVPRQEQPPARRTPPVRRSR
jgi:cell division septal protein FtsQ